MGSMCCGSGRCHAQGIQAFWATVVCIGDFVRKVGLQTAVFVQCSVCTPLVCALLSYSSVGRVSFQCMDTTLPCSADAAGGGSSVLHFLLGVHWAGVQFAAASGPSSLLPKAGRRLASLIVRGYFFVRAAKLSRNEVLAHRPRPGGSFNCYGSEGPGLTAREEIQALKDQIAALTKLLGAQAELAAAPAAKPGYGGAGSSYYAKGWSSAKGGTSSFYAKGGKLAKEESCQERVAELCA
jgi:hypothetical protein